MTKKAFGWLFVLVFIAASFLRLGELGLRPMHHDEANQALKFGLLLEQGQYRYDPTDHHGPSLYYLSWPLARLLGGRTLASQSESTMRSVPALFGLGTMILLLLFLPHVGHPAALFSTLGLALSPAMVYFSRFYIQETLLVFFLTGFLASLCRYVRRPSGAWALSIGFFAGMMYATKETSAIAFAAALLALSLTILIDKKKEKRAIRRPRVLHFLAAMGIGILVSALLFSSFFQNPAGVLDSVLSFKIYFVRAGETALHIQPWFYYLKLLFFSRPKGGPFWSEAFLLVLAFAGSIASFRTKGHFNLCGFFLKFLFFYTVITTAVFSLIPYKTPWNLLPFHLGVILLAGPGATAILEGVRKARSRGLIIFLLAAGFFHLAWQSWRANFVFPADPRNPYVYAQTSTGYLKLVDRVEGLASVHPEGRKMLVKVAASPYETWPLPWSLRKFERVGYWQKAADISLADRPAIVIASAEEATALEPSINTLYRSEYYELRPNVLLVLFVREDVWEDYLKRDSVAEEY